MKAKPKAWKPPTKPKLLPGPRVCNWPTAIATLVEKHRNEPRVWGEHDCCQWARKFMHTVTGKDPMPPGYVGKYETELGAAKWLAKKGGVAGIAEEVCARLGYPEIAVNLAGRGDLVMQDISPNGPSLGGCLGALSAFVDKEKMVFIPTLHCRRAWRVG